MKKIELLCVAGLVALLSAPIPLKAQPASLAPNWDGRVREVETKIAKKEYAAALGELDDLLATAELKPSDRLRLLNAGMRAASQRTPSDLTVATAYLEKILKDPSIPNAGKITALSVEANAYIQSLAGKNLDEMELGPAYASLKRAMDLPGLTAQDKALALTQLGSLADREAKYSEARTFYSEILGLEIPEPVKDKARQALANGFIDEGMPERAFEIYRQRAWNLEPVYRRLGDEKGIIAESLKLLRDNDIPEARRWNTFSSLPVWNSKGDLEQKRQLWDEFSGPYLAKDANRAILLKRLALARDTTDEVVQWAVPLVLTAPQLNDKDYQALKSRLLESLASPNLTDRLRTEASAIAGDTRCDAETRLWALLVSAPEAAAKGINTDAVGPLSAREKASATIRAGKTVLGAGDEVNGRKLYTLYEGLLARPPKASITCNFMDHAPDDVGSWLNSPLLTQEKNRGKLDRPYGDNLEFLLLTDSAVEGRKTEAKAAGAESDSDTDFYTVCDTRGIHFFFYAHDSQAENIADGLTSGGSFEIYLAPGEHQPYYTFMPEVPDGRVEKNVFLSAYPSSGFRLPAVEDGTLRSEGRMTAHGFCLYMFLDWASFYDKLPEEGTRWQFEAFRWSRAGGFSFGGSESVHNRSSFGDVVFAGLSGDRRKAIKRAIIFRAAARYREAKKVTGSAGKWNDRDLGDVKFYETEVLPLLRKLDSFESLATKTISKEDIELLFREAVPGWMEIEYKIAALRDRYLREKLIVMK